MLVHRYRALGADLPRTDLRRHHPVAMEGYFWRFWDAATGQALIALCGVCDNGGAESWATVALAAGPGDFIRHADVPVARAATDHYRVSAGADGAVLAADAESLRVDLGPGACLQVRLEQRREWATPWLGGLGLAQLIPGLGQYWHPHLFGATVTGEAVIGERTLRLDGWGAYAEKNWGRGGFPARWWWGQAAGFTDAPEVCLAFAGGQLSSRLPGLAATAVVIDLGDRRVRLANPLLSPVRVSADGEHWQLRGRAPGWSIQLDGSAPAAAAHQLPVPLIGEGRSVPLAREQLTAEVAVVLRRRGRIAFAGQTSVGGLEIGRLD